MTPWLPPTELPDLRRAGLIALDTETNDEGLAADRGSAWPWGGGYVCGVSIAYREGADIRAIYFPLRHPDTENVDRAQFYRWLANLLASDVRVVTQYGLYDFGWLHADAAIKMPPAGRLEEIGALATIVDENRYSYGLDALCKWRGLPGKDMALLEQGAAAIGLPKKVDPRAHIWQMPACFVGPYAEADAVRTLELLENLNPVLDREGTGNAYRLDVELLPMVLEMRRRGVRINTAAAERSRDLLLGKRDAALTELSAKFGANVSMAEIAGKCWLAETFDKLSIKYPRTEKGNPSFTAGRSGWMHKHPHWLPQLIAKANKYNKAAVDFLEGHILRHVVNGRIHPEIHPHRSEDEHGTRSSRFSYSDPPLQQMPSRDEELAPLIRGCFLPEEGQVWAKPDISQQEFRFIVHYAVKFGLQRAQEAADRYRADPNTDFHQVVAEMTGLERTPAKDTNFAKSYGAGPRKFAAMIGKPESEAAAIYDLYDRELPFVSQLAERCEYLAKTQGYLELYDGARRHWDQWMPPVAWGKGTLAPCSREEAQRRITDPEHAWYRRGPLRRVDVHKAMNALIQGSAARHTKLWMRAVWREGIVPLLQMHDSVDCSVSSPEQAELVAQLGRDAVTLEVPIVVDLKYGRTWGDATHTWEGLHGAAPAAKPMVPETVSTDADAPEITLAPAPADPIDDLGLAAPGNGGALGGLLGGDPDDHCHGDGGADGNDPDHDNDDLNHTSADRSAQLAGAGVGERAEMPAPFELGMPGAAPEDCAVVQPSKPNGGGTAAGERTAGDGRDQNAGGERFNGHNGDYGDRSSEQHAGKPYGPTRIRLIAQGYRVAQTFPFQVPGETEPRFFEDRWELKPEITPTKERPRKTCRYWHRANGQELNDTGPRRIIYNWPAIMAAGPGTNVFITEGANKCKPLNEKGLLATAAPYHQWGPECTAALAGYHLFYLADHCNLLMGWDAHDNDPAARYAEDAKKKLAPRAASFRIVPAAHLWKYLPPGARTIHQSDDVKDWLELGGEPAKLLEICREVPAEGSKNDDPLFWHGEPDPRPRRKWRIKQLMPGVGAGLLSGQWGTYKTFMAIELATTVIAGETQFCGRRLVEPCGVLILATEGAFELRDRIDAAVHNKYPDMAHAPITWRESCPTLLADGAAEQLIKIVQEAAEGCKARFGLPLGLVIIDVLTDAAGYAKAGDENGPAIGAKLMGVFRRAAEACGCFLLAVDHFGKSVEAGTRGTSAKEGSADAILACLGEREVSGTVTNTRLALRKVRGGPQGQEFPYKPRVVSILEPREEDGSETTCVIDWEAAAAAPSDPWESAARQAEAKLAMRALRRAMMKLLAEHGVEIVSEPGAAAIRMVTQELVREEFYANTVADGDSKQKQNVKRQRFHRALARAEDQNLIGRRDIEGTAYLWFINL